MDWNWLNKGLFKKLSLNGNVDVNMNELYFKAWSAIVKAYESIGDSESAANFQAKREQIQQVIWDKKVESDLKGRNYLFK